MQWAAWQRDRQSCWASSNSRPCPDLAHQPRDAANGCPVLGSSPQQRPAQHGCLGALLVTTPCPRRQQDGNWIPVLSGFQPCREGGIFSFPSWKPTGSSPTVAQQCRLQAQATSLSSTEYLEEEQKYWLG